MLQIRAAKKSLKKILRRDFRIGDFPFSGSILFVTIFCLVVSYFIFGFNWGSTKYIEDAKKGDEKSGILGNILNHFLSGITGFESELLKDGRIKVTVPIQRESKGEPGKKKKGEKIFYITPSISGPIYIEEIGGSTVRKGEIHFTKEGAIVNMPGKEAIVKMPNVKEVLKTGQLGANRQAEIEWREEGGRKK